MLKKVTNYVDFDGNNRTEEMYFNLTQTELMELAMDMPDDIADSVGNDPTNVSESAASKLVEKLGSKGIMDYLKMLVLKSYGVKSEDGRRFEKSEEISREFSQTIAYDNLMMELLTKPDSANEFITGIIPANTADKIPAIGTVAKFPN